MCETCNQSLTRGQGRFCSLRCAARAPRPERRRLTHCEVCGVEYQRTYWRQRTCSRACGVLVNSRTTWPSCRIFARYCTQCGEAFTAQRERTTCGKRCADAAYRDARRVTPMCARCGVEVDHRGNCEPCRQAVRRERKRRDKARRRALKAGAACEPVSPSVVFARDNWRCHICGKKAKRDAVAPHPLSATIDHLVPLADGGDHTYANLATAHFICNARRGTGGQAQLALIG